MPSQRTTAGGSKRICVKNRNEASQLLNAKLSKALSSLKHKLPQSRIVYIDLYNPFLDIIQRPQNYGNMYSSSLSSSISFFTLIFSLQFLFSSNGIALLISGFEVTNLGCCGTGKIEVILLCNKFSKTCPDDTKYVFWDSFHPTEQAYKVIVSSIVKNYIRSFI